MAGPLSPPRCSDPPSADAAAPCSATVCADARLRTPLCGWHECDGHAFSLVTPPRAQVITDCSLVRMKDDRPLEAVITSGFKNPGIVRTIAYSWLCHRSSRSSSSAATPVSSANADSPASVAWDSANSHPRDDGREMWMLLEYCDRGSLLVRPPGILSTAAVTGVCPCNHFTVILQQTSW